MSFFRSQETKMNTASDGGNYPVGPVTEPEVRYQNISPDELYAYVQARGSIF